jgi:2-oxoglutarate/2-oxoacid ferredoxin oxidoreductase subunit beta
METMSKKDFQSDNEVRWCPGCGDYAILATVQKTLAELGMNKDDTVFVSGIGCAARFPYYMNTYGMHTIHGRAPAFAFGVKLANPRLKVFLVTGDGDGLSIGANHLVHLFRRNINVTVLLFNNEIYGLTKGQYSPTSRQGQKAKSTPFGALETPINPVFFALSAGAGFVARSIDNDASHLGNILKEAITYSGTSFIEILQNCVVFNDGAFDFAQDKSKRLANVLQLQENQPLLFDNNKRGIAFDQNMLMPKIVLENEVHEAMIHKPRLENLQPYLLASLSRPNFPIPVGIFRQIERPTYEQLKADQDKAILASANQDLRALLQGNNLWVV